MHDKHHTIFYNSYEVNTKSLKETKLVLGIELIKLNTLEITIKKKNNQIINLGCFYVVFDKNIRDEEYNKIISKVLKNIDTIVFDNYRYIGNFTKELIEDEEIIKALKEKNYKQEDEELGKIYSEYLNTAKSKIEYKNYSCFLEIYLYQKHYIPDSIKQIYLLNKGKKILNYDNLDEEILKDFSGNTYEPNVKNIEHNNIDIKNLEDELNDINKELDILNGFIKSKNIIVNIDMIILTLENKKEQIGKSINKIKMPIIGHIRKSKLLKIKGNIEKDILKLKDTKDESIESLALDIKKVYKNIKITKDLSYIKLELSKLNKAVNNKKDKVEKQIENLEKDNEKCNKNEMDLSMFYERINKC